MADFTLTQYVRQADGSFDPYTFEGSVQSGGSNLGGLPKSAKYQNTLFIGDAIHEGDRVKDADGNIYDVHARTPYWFGDQFDHYQAELYLLETVTLKSLTLGSAADSITGIYPSTYASTSIYMNIAAKAQSQIRTLAGYTGKYEYVGVTADEVHEGDQIVHRNGVLYEVVSAMHYPSARTDFGFNWTVVGLIQRDYASMPSFSGAWHTDSMTRTDPRWRFKVLLDDQLEPLGVSELISLDGATYPISRLFTAKNVGAVCVISRGNSIAEYAIDKKPYCFNEGVLFDLYAVDKTDTTATNLLERYEQAIRTVLTDYAVGSIRTIRGASSSPIELGYGYISHLTLQMNYKRANDDYTSTYPTITWGPSAAPTGTYTIPNITQRQLSTATNMPQLTIPGRIGSIIQKLGMPSFIFTFTCDTTMETNKTWLRPQTTETKTDVLPWQIFYDIQFNGQIDQAYQTMDLGWGGTVQVVLADVNVPEEGTSSRLELTFWGYNSAGGSSYKTWFGIDP